jgi:hypothetical protein
MPSFFQKKLTELLTPAGKSPTVAAGQGPKKLNTKKVVIYGSFGVDAANAPVNVRGDGFAVARTGVGVYEVSLGALTDALGRYQVKEFLAILPKLGKGAASSLDVEPGAETPASGKFEIRVVNRSTGAASNPAAAGTNERISFSVAFDVGI